MLSWYTATSSSHTLGVIGVGVLPTQSNLNYPPTGILLWSQQQKQPNDLILRHRVVTKASQCDITSDCKSVRENWGSVSCIFVHLACFQKHQYSNMVRLDGEPFIWTRFDHTGVPFLGSCLNPRIPAVSCSSQRGPIRSHHLNFLSNNHSFAVKNVNPTPFSLQHSNDMVYSVVLMMVTTSLDQWHHRKMKCQMRLHS